MGNRATLFRFRIELSDIDRGVYETLDFRAALHPSETTRFLATRVLAYALNFQEGIEFTPGGISDTEEPALRVVTLDGRINEWIEIGNPSAKKLHKATKSASVVKVYAHKDPNHLMLELAKDEVHKADEIEVYFFSGELMQGLEDLIEKDNKWSVMHTEGAVTVTTPTKSVQGEVRRVREPRG